MSCSVGEMVTGSQEEAERNGVCHLDNPHWFLNKIAEGFFLFFFFFFLTRGSVKAGDILPAVDNFCLTSFI